MFKTKQIKIITALLLLNLAISPLPGKAQSSLQTASIVITNTVDVATLTAPASLQMPSSFSFHEGNNEVYEAFLPDFPENRIRVADTRNVGGFLVDMTATDFSDGTESIPFQNIGIVTLSGTNHPYSVNCDGTNRPPYDDSGTVFAPLHCDFPSGTEIESCENYGQGFLNFTGNGATSDPLLIIDGQNPTTGGRKGAWYVGLGIKLAIPPGLSTNTYNSTITLTLTTT